MAIDLTRAASSTKEAYVKWNSARMESMRGFRVPYWSYWAALAEVYYPQKYKFFVTPNNYSRGAPINQAIVDETGLLAARTLATGLLSGLTSPTKPWFRLGLAGAQDIPEGPIKSWLAECTRRMQEVYSKSNLYAMLGTAYHQLGVFGSAALIQYEDPEDVVRFFNPVAGEYFFGLDNRLEVDTLYREYTYTIAECVKEFGREALPESLQNMARTASSQDFEVVIGHAIEPNTTIYDSDAEVAYLVPRSFPYRETYWVRWGGASTLNTSNCGLLRASGFREQPFVGLRWDVTSNDAYGRSPGMDALPAVRQLQIEQRRKAEAIDKMVRPPMVASISMKNEPMDTLPGGVSYVADPAAAGFKPAYTVEPRIQEMKEDIAEVQRRVRDIFFNPLFQMFTPDQTVQTATWVDAAREEKLILLGPVIERTENEGLDEIITRTFNIMQRRGLFPDPPPELAAQPLVIQYISILAEAQRAASTAGIERLLALVGSLVGIKPDALDTINVDEAVTQYADLLNVDPAILNSVKVVLEMRQARAEQQQAAAALQVGAEAASGAKVLSETDVSSPNALTTLLGGVAA